MKLKRLKYKKSIWVMLMQIEEYNRIVAEIETLPVGGITYKNINGKRYAYYQWREDGKQMSRRVKDDEIEDLSRQIERRKNLQEVIKADGIVASMNAFKTSGGMMDALGGSFKCLVRIGAMLDSFVKPVAKWKKRDCYKDLSDYIYGEVQDKVYILYGLRRTGKTTLIKQIISDMSASNRKKAAFIQVRESMTLANMNSDLRLLEDRGYKYIFIDEVTLLDDFIEGAALFSDIFAASGMKIVLSGTDSLGFMFAEDEQLYDRCIMSHTTFIPYSEFERVLGIVGIDEYIQYGGTMSLGGRDYNAEQSLFATRKTTNEYVDSAIAKNIQHSLRNYDYERHFRSLRELYEQDELTNVINRIVEDINHRFTIEVLTKDFVSNDLALSANNLRKDRKKPSDVLDRINTYSVNERLMQFLEIKNKEEQEVEINDAHRIQIKEYLDLLDLTVDIENRWMADFNRKDMRTVFSQPGIRYSQAKALVDSLLVDDFFRDVPFAERKRVIVRIMDEVRGRMMDDIVLLETKKAKKQNEVFRLLFAVGEYDMVVADAKSGTCEIYEIKHSKEKDKNQCRHLLDRQKLKETEFRYGEIVGRYVIYRGESDSAAKGDKKDDIKYLNVEEYLKGL